MSSRNYASLTMFLSDTRTITTALKSETHTLTPSIARKMNSALKPATHTLTPSGTGVLNLNSEGFGNLEVFRRQRHEGTHLKTAQGTYEKDGFDHGIEVHMSDRQTVCVEKDAMKIVRSAIDSADMIERIRERLQVIDSTGEGVTMEVDGQRYNFNKNVYLVAYGKGVLNIVERAAEHARLALLEHIVQGIAVIPEGMIKCNNNLFKDAPEVIPIGVPVKKLAGNIEIFGAAPDKRPDKKTEAVSHLIIEMCKKVKKDDIILVVCTGGGSNLFQLPRAEDDVSQETINELISQMQQKGADREEINMMRRHLSAVKGGRFAIMMQHTKILTLIISDVIGDRMETIASGPTFPEMTSPVMCLDVLANYQIEIDDVRQYFEKRSREEDLIRKEHKLSGSHLPAHRDRKQFSHVQNILLANNREVIEGAVMKAEKLGYRAVVLSNQEFGQVKEKAEMYAKLFPFICRLLRRKLEQADKYLAWMEMELVRLGIDKAKAKEIAARANVAVNTNSGLCIVIGGEFVCPHQPGGVGGPYQEMALHVARLLHQQKDNKMNLTEEFECVFLAFDTDGIDGSTTAAGAWVNADLIEQTKSSGLSPVEALESSNTFEFFNALEDGKYLITTGHIALDLMGLILLLVRPRNMDPAIKIMNE